MERNSAAASPSAQSTTNFAKLTACGVTLTALVLALGVVTAELGWFNPFVVGAWICLTPVAIHLADRFAREVVALAPGTRPPERKAVVVGADALGRLFRTRVAGVRGIRFCGYFDDRSMERLGVTREELLGPLGEVAQFARTRRADVVYIALPMTSRPRMAGLLQQLNDTTASVYVVPDIALLAPIQPRLETVAGTPVVRVCETPFLGMNAVVKRTEDLVLGALIFLACLPVMLVIALAVKLGSPGPVIFRQRRHGLDGREIVVYKFRTMRVLEDGLEFRQARRDDPRITKVGAFLRRYSLDELPQLLNVLQGHMSLVGPRPHAVAMNDLYRNVISGYMIRHKVRPGITGWAQVNGFRGETDTLEKMKARVEHDLAYVSNWSLLLDLSILARTAWAVVRGRNAY